MSGVRLLIARLSGVAIAGGVIVFLLLSRAEGRRVERIDFSREIRPIFASHCAQCHGAQRQEAGLRLDQRDAALRGGDSGPAIVPGNSARSPLWQRIAGYGDAERMPPAGDAPPLTAGQIDLIRRWIDEGALWPGDSFPELRPAPKSDHWSFQPIVRPEPPPVADAAWPRNDIDRFVLARLEADGLAPAPEADRATLIRRLSYDLLGLPPEPGEVEEFLHDPAPDAYERLVDRLLASPHFGERWGRHWLDMARYADSDGYERDDPRPDAWMYRDWVINAINADMPFDRFTIEQLAGDLLPDAGPMQKLATAFHRQTLTNREFGVDREEFRYEPLFDRVATTGTVWLGLTLGCARCHEHRYDPVSQTEYYELLAFFNDSFETTLRFPVSEEAAALDDRLRPAWEEKHQELEQRLEALRKETERRYADRLAEWEARLREDLAVADDPNSILPFVLAFILEVSPPERTDFERSFLHPILIDRYSGDAELAEAKAALEAHRAGAPPEGYINARVFRPAHRRTYVLHRGDFLKPTIEATPGVPRVLHPLQPRDPARRPDRLDLARWIVDPANPLTPRVVVNQIWMHLFGQGLVATPEDFGLQGEPPSHPELLDWLADQFLRHGWSRKAMIRTIVTSATYRQSSRRRPELDEIDPRNRLLARQNRFRVEAEIVRDLQLAAAGLLSRKIGGPSVFPPMAAHVAGLSYAHNFQWHVSEGEDRYRRGMYTFFKRTAPHPMLMAFDCPDANTSSVRRERTNTPLQALVLLNNEAFVEAAQALARRIWESNATDDEERLAYAFRLCVARSPDDREQEVLAELLQASREYYAAHADDALRFVGNHHPPAISASEAAAWVAVARVLLNLDEFIVRE